MSLKKFSNWVSKTYGDPAPAELLAFLKDHPDGLALGNGLILYGIEDIQIYTEERELEEKGVLYLGAGDLSVFLLRVKDGKVFLVDSTDYQEVDASFKGIDTCVMLLNQA
ncbi:hypothetical protein [Pseudomonas putida]|uniref:SMI1/KNR4 family protein n=1 Tax=Pseudomonas putida TaxID=303 RepID=A0A8I1EH83_PSEPU|nr:hypothetical protein [Pseudomonas putida]